MLFIIQNSQNRHTIAIQLKLDEITRATKSAHNEMMDIEKLTDDDLMRLQKKIWCAYGKDSKRPKERQTRHTYSRDYEVVIEGALYLSDFHLSH